MFPRKRKVVSSLGVVKPESRLLRLFRSNDVSQGSLVSLESTEREDTSTEDQKIIGNALLEIEYQRAKALQAFQRNQRFY